MKQILMFSKDLSSQGLRNHEVLILEELRKQGILHKVESGCMHSIAIPKDKLDHFITGNEAVVVAMPIHQFTSQWNDNDLRVDAKNHDVIISQYEEITTFKLSF